MAEVSRLPGPGLTAGAGWRRWLQLGAAGLVAAVAAYASYEHQRAFALAHGAHGVAAAVWPLSVDGLLILASLALLDPGLVLARSWVRLVVRMSFVAGICVSLAANVAAAGGSGRWGWAGVLVAGWPPVALLLSAEILIHSTNRDGGAVAPLSHADVSGQSRPVPAMGVGGEIVSPEPGTQPAVPGNGREDSPASGEALPPGRVVRRGEAQRVMWEHYRAALAAGHAPTGAELDRIAGTTDYGRAVLARWRRTGRIPASMSAETGSTVDTESTPVSATSPGTYGSVTDISSDPARPFGTHPSAADAPGAAVTDSPAGRAGESGRAAA